MSARLPFRSKPELKGFVYVESFREMYAKEALKGNHFVMHMKPYKLVPRTEMVTTLTTTVSAVDHVKPKVSGSAG